jgi:hypothetical protein
MSNYKIGDVTKFLREKLTGSTVTDGTPTTTNDDVKKSMSKKRRRAESDLAKPDETNASVGEDALLHFSTEAPDKHDDEAIEPKRKRRKVCFWVLFYS